VTLDELENTLPWGLHDAQVERLSIDWARAELTLEVRAMIGEHQETDQRARITLTGLDYCAIEPPRYRTRPAPGAGMWVQPDAAPAEIDGHPPVATGCFRHRFFVSDLNCCFYVAASDARLEWLESAPQPSRTGDRAYFPAKRFLIRTSEVSGSGVT